MTDYADREVFDINNGTHPDAPGARTSSITLTPVDREPRIWSGRVWTKDDPFVGKPFVFKAPYGVYMNATQLLARALATRQITRYSIGPTPKKKIGQHRASLTRYEEAFERLSLQLGINWSA